METGYHKILQDPEREASQAATIGGYRVIGLRADRFARRAAMVMKSFGQKPGGKKPRLGRHQRNKDSES